jgi:anti-sigma factor RsiW
MTVQVDDALLAAYVDGELGSDQVADVERLLATHAEARRKVEQMRRVNALLRTTFSDQRFLPPPAKFLALAARSRNVAEPRRSHRIMANPWTRRIVAASLLALAFIGGHYGSPTWWEQTQDIEDTRAELLDEIAEYHVIYARETEHLVEVPAERQGHIEEWLGARLNRKLTVPDLSHQGLEFAGARMLVLAGNPVAQLVYTRDTGAPVAFCIAFGEKANAPLTITELHSMTVGYWDHGGYTYVIVGALSQEAVRNIAAKIEV